MSIIQSALLEVLHMRAKITLGPGDHHLELSVLDNGDVSIELSGLDSKGRPTTTQAWVYGPMGGGFGRYPETYEALVALAKAICDDTSSDAGSDSQGESD